MEWWLPEITIIALGFASRTVSVVSDHQTSQHQLNLIISSWENWYSDSSIIYRDIVISILSSTWHHTESPRSPESSAPCYKLTVWNIVILPGLLSSHLLSSPLLSSQLVDWRRVTANLQLVVTSQLSLTQLSAFWVLSQRVHWSAHLLFTADSSSVQLNSQLVRHPSVWSLAQPLLTKCNQV